MIDALFPSYPLPQDVVDDLLDTIRRDWTFWGPCSGEDEVWRLQPLPEGLWPANAVTTFLTVKKLLLPQRAALWSHDQNSYRKAGAASPVAVIGVPLCDLQAVWYLDQVFAEDEPYLDRRKQLLLIGMPCEPGAECRCSRQLMPLAGDLFVGADRVWALSRAGQGLLLECACGVAEEMPLPWPEGPDGQRSQISEDLFLSSAAASIWFDESQRCLSCGACSAVCPTCYCFDLLDSAALDGSVVRRRAWDNCFFAEHGKVAGGHDFRPGRADRLRFRMEHKLLGFGDLRGQNSCVGCGRCRGVCPAEIDLDRIAEQLHLEVGS